MISAILESLVEPFALIHSINLDFSARVKAEGAAMLISCITRFICLVVFELGIISFSLAQLAHVITLLLVYLMMHSLRLHKHYPRPFKLQGKKESIFMTLNNK